MPKLTERADAFAKKYAHVKPVEDTRSTDEKLAAFHKEFEPKSLKEARRRMKAAKGRSNAK